MARSLLALAAAAAVLVLSGGGDAPAFVKSSVEANKDEANKDEGGDSPDSSRVKSHENKEKSEANALQGEANKAEGGDLLSADSSRVKSHENKEKSDANALQGEANKDEGGDLLSLSSLLANDLHGEANKAEGGDLLSLDLHEERAAKLEQELSEIQHHLDSTIETVWKQMAVAESFLWTSVTRAGTARVATRLRKAMVAVQETGIGELMEPFMKRVPPLALTAKTRALNYHNLLKKYKHEMAYLERVEKGERENQTPQSISKKELAAYHQSWANLDEVYPQCDSVEHQLERNVRGLIGEIGRDFATRFSVSIRQLQFHGQHGEMQRLQKESKWGEWSKKSKNLIKAAISNGEKFYGLWTKLQDAEKEVDEKLDTLVSHDEIRSQLLSRISGHQLEARTHVQRLKFLAEINSDWTFTTGLDDAMERLMDVGEEGAMLDLLREARRSLPRSSEEDCVLGGAIDAGREYRAAQKELQILASEN